MFVAVIVGFEVDLLSDSVSLSVSNWVSYFGPDCDSDYELRSVKHDLIHITSGATFFSTVPCRNQQFFTLLRNSNSYAEVKLPASPVIILDLPIDAILVAINKRNTLCNTNKVMRLITIANGKMCRCYYTRGHNIIYDMSYFTE